MEMTTDIVDIEPTEMLLKNIEKFPYLEKYIEENNGDLPACFFEEELFTLDEWKEYFEQQVFERLGFKINISSSE